ncbi:uncharacterized protein LOC125653804 [Ostrea edulis]|uniref:uncharacterized protein LOC125653804 n=1 Tax=Ostrea edulis TaxID=37623 RepID=UPI0024AEF8F6|nr:uncharacterized protein LOC125653804 [Ostrea edulis]
MYLSQGRFNAGGTAILHNILQSLPTRWLRIVVSEMENDLNTEKRTLAQLGNIPEPIGEDMKLDPSFMKELDFLSGVIIGFDVNNNIIEDFLDPSTHFLKNCFGGNSFDLIDDPVYLNSVVNDVLDCAVIGVDLLMDLVDIAPVRDTDLRSELIRRMQLMGEIAYEIQALTELLNELKRNVEDDCIDQ